MEGGARAKPGNQLVILYSRQRKAHLQASKTEIPTGLRYLISQCSPGNV